MVLTILLIHNLSCITCQNIYKKFRLEHVFYDHCCDVKSLHYGFEI